MKDRSKNQSMGYVCLLPLAILVGLFMLFPFLNGLYLSFFSTKFGFGDLKFAWFDNYINAIQMDGFIPALWHSFIWVAVTLLLNSIVPLFIALLINREFKGKSLILGGILIPWITPVIAFSMIFKWILEPNFGVLSRILKDMGLINQGIDFLGNPDYALLTLIFLNFWQFMPLGVLLLSSALSTIPKEHYEAMKVDGANYMQTLKNLIMPCIGNMMGFSMFLGTVQTFNNYVLIYMLTRGGPVGSTVTIPLLIYQKAFVEFNVGYAMALASMVGLILIILGVWYFRKFLKE
ncbi:MAG: carbohydrate ABC transporter permease [Neglectibacter timonensis]